MMDSMLLSSYTSSTPDGGDSGHQMESLIPRWKIPLSKSFSSTFYNERKPISPVVEEESGRRSTNEERQNTYDRRHPEPDAIIQILLPCIICNRTFSPEALERHSKVCTKVNLIEKKSSRPTYDSHAMRIKNTKVADFIPPPEQRDPPPPLTPFSRSSSFRRSLQSRGSMKEKTLSSLTPTDPSRRLLRAESTPKTLTFQDTDNFGTNSSDFGSSEDSGENNQSSLPSYARALSPSEDCPYCLRSFGLKAYDRHVAFCRDLWERRQFETQPTPKDLEVARERQDIRTKYRPLKGSNSCSSLRSMSPGKESVHNFATVALKKLFGGGMNTSGNYNFKKSNDSLATSCYGDFARSRSLRLPSPGRHLMAPASKIPTAMRVNTNSNHLTKTKSIERLEHVPSSGYGPGGVYMNNFTRNSKIRSSLGRNFFRNGKRSEPEGLENTTTPNYMNSSPLIITPMNFYNKSSYGSHTHQDSSKSESPTKSTLLSSDPKYDPYEKAAKQLEELLKSQPQQPQRSNTQRKLGLDRALASVMGLGNTPSSSKPPPRQSYNQLYSYLRNEDPFLNISADESYWDEILKAKKKEHETQEAPSIPNNNQTISHHTENRGRDREREFQTSTAEDEKRDSSDSSMDNFKYRGISNISSADSAFSRSDGTDLEFEALESLMSVGNLPAPPGRSASSISRLPAIHRGDKNNTTTTATTAAVVARGGSSSNERNIFPTNQSFGSQSYESGKKDKEPMTTSQSQHQLQLLPTYAKFCHECGMSYPTPVAKFCPECGERRVINV